MSIKKVVDIDVRIIESNTKLSALTTQLNSLDKGTEEYAKTLKALNIERANSIKLSKQQALSSAKVVSATEKAVTSTKKLKTGTGQANQAVQEIGRGITDLPYGIQGVANNMSQLTSVFGGMVQSSGSVSLALKGVWASMMGPLGIVLAFQAVIAIIQTEWFSSLISMESSLYDIEEAFESVREEVGKEINTLNDLVTAFGDTTLSLEEHEKIKKKIEEDYPQYLGKLDLDKVAHEDIAKAVLQETDAIIGLGIVKSVEAKQAEQYAILADQRIAQAKLNVREFQDIRTGQYGPGNVVTAEAQRGFAQAVIDSAVAEAEGILATYATIVTELKEEYGISTKNLLGLDGDDDDDGGDDAIKGISIFGSKVSDIVAKLNIASALASEKYAVAFVQRVTKQYEKEVAEREKSLIKNETLIQKYGDKYQELYDASGITKLENDRDRLISEVEDVENAEQTKYEITQYYDELIEKKKQDNAEKAKQRTQDEAQFALRAFGGMFSALSDLQEEGSKQQQELAIAGVLMDSASAAIGIWKGWSEFGPWGIAGAAAQTIALAASTKSAIDQIRSAGSGGNSTSYGAPNYSVVGSSPTDIDAVNQTTGAVQNVVDTPTRAFITSADVATADALNRQIEANTSL